MGSRYTKSIPEKIWFQDLKDGWFAGPFVKKPQHPGKYRAFKLIPADEYMRFVIPIGELTEEEAIECMKKLRKTYAEKLDFPDSEIYLNPNEENSNT